MLLGERILKLRVNNHDLEIPIRVYAPERCADGGWFCRYSIGWPDRNVEKKGWGHDALQAMFLTLQSIGVDIYMSAFHASGQLTWVSSWQGYGFPVPRDARDLLVGDDARFEG